MPNKIQITSGNLTVFAELNDSPTARAIWDALPITARANRWGDEIYFAIPVKCAQEPDARDVVQMGELGYWVPGHAFCIFFGPTPASEGDEIRAASAVNIIGRVEGDARVFKQVKDEAAITLSKV
ncbi:MAG: cyclophilin-like fold protein [Anaerolineae bacterium]|nr:cyclophilin-like fold protein [Anaerolineae bacterium]